jgi:uncharacterized protein
MKFGLNQITIDKIITVFKKHQTINEVIIYGSRAKGNFRDGSYIDLTLKGKNLNDSIISDLESEIDELNTPYLFDISLYDHLNSSDLIEHINRVGQVFYQKDNHFNI